MVEANKKVLFYQHFGKPGVVRGAHHKTFDFYHHVKALEGYEPVIYFDKESLWDERIPWFHLFDAMPTLDELDCQPDILFINSGKDWLKLSNHFDVDGSIPIVSPVNNFRATKPGHPSYDLLKHPAVRLCPSPELYRAVHEHPDTQGTTYYFPNGVGVSDAAKEQANNKTVDVLIVGNKNPDMANALHEKLSGLPESIEIINGWIDKDLFQMKLAQSKISVHLPKLVEEHYIPGIESMMLSSIPIIPDCIGNRSYSLDKETCLMADYTIEGFIHALTTLLNSSDEFRTKLLQQGKASVDQYAMDIEQANILKALQTAIAEHSA